MVLRQKNVTEMHNLVLELDNNLSFGSNDEQNILQMGKALKNIFMESAPDFGLAEKNVIGKGTYATVYKCQLHGTDIAVKVFDGTKNIHISQEVQLLWSKTGQNSIGLKWASRWA